MYFAIYPLAGYDSVGILGNIVSRYKGGSELDVEKIVVVGGSGRVGREVCRLGVALGHEMYSVCLSGAAPTDEPWTQGVTWVKGNVEKSGEWETTIEDSYAVVITPPITSDHLTTLRESSTKLIWVAKNSADFGVLDARDSLAVVKAITNDEEQLSSDDLIRVEQFAMALLRLALEPRPGVLNHEELVVLGDAMMIQ